MKLTGRRESSNVEDRRGLSGGAKAGIGGIGAIIVAALFAWMSGGDPVSAGLQAAQEQMSARTESVNPEEFSEEEQQLATECKQILASDGCLQGTGSYLRVAYTGALHQSGQLCLRLCYSSSRSVLLFWRSETVYRPVVLHADEAPVGCRG